MAARNVNLTDHLANFVDANVATGRFQNASEVVREGLRLLEQRQREDDLKLERLRQAVELGREDARHGRTLRIEPGEVDAFLAGLGRTGRPTR
ncbi:MAG: addiction module antidote protein [Caulobacter sp. 12-67-6]|nr:MAG: addiction module antidote protein [Caulobacter sp. 12-67-6]OYX69149.1 MAG: addiction module antidote protein [Caulobacter sp. 32-67-35]OYX96343.1 MAG: addiction module antidote protein [Caulobacter sp. 35-67-4]HQR90341.1 type II toxin-antitoxin system ParD family antitoxin [Caulobacter sp.]